MGKDTGEKAQKQKLLWAYGATMLLVLISIVFAVLVFLFYMKNTKEINEENSYGKYYTMIVEDKKSAFWQSVYKGAYKQGQKEGAYVELLGENLSQDYSRAELMEIAISSEVDGILVEADESQEMADLIDRAVEAEIPVITLYSDCTRSSRLSFVGAGSYNLGIEYGRQVLEIINPFEKSNAMILVSANAQDTGQNILCSGIQETIEKEKNRIAEVEISYLTVDDTNMFSTEESIRDILMEEELPDIIICLNELNTTCAYQAVVDHNKVGQVDIVGYYNLDSTINAIDRGVIYSTLVIDTAQLGSYGINALTVYDRMGKISEYFTTDISIINKGNVYQSLEGGQDEESKN